MDNTPYIRRKKEMVKSTKLYYKLPSVSIILFTIIVFAGDT